MSHSLMKQFEEILRKDNCFYPSEIEGLPDLIWSMGLRTISSNKETLIKWFHSPIPAFDNRIPMDILSDNGVDALFHEMTHIPC